MNHSPTSTRWEINDVGQLICVHHGDESRRTVTTGTKSLGC